MRLFISYERNQEGLVQPLLEELTRRGHEVLWDKQLVPGERWKEQLGDFIAQSEVFLYALTPKSLASEWCQWEFTQALLERKPVVPILLEGEMKALPTMLAERHCIDARGGLTRDKLDEISRTVEQTRVRRAPSLLRKGVGGAAMVLIVGLLALLFWREAQRDPTTSAEKRYQDALVALTGELTQDVTALGGLVQALESAPPKPFWDKRRPNENEAAYQDRAAADFRDYASSISLMGKQVKYSRTQLDSFRRDLNFNPEIARAVQKTYGHLDEVSGYFNRYQEDLQHLLRLNLNDTERTARAVSLQQERLAEMRQFLSQAAAWFCTVATGDTDVQIVSIALALAGVPGSGLRPGTQGYQRGMALAAKYAQEKAQILEMRLQIPAQATAREIDRRVNDPYLQMLRKAANLPPTLTEAELARLQNKPLNLDEAQPEKLLEYAGESYQEADGNATVRYLQKALDSGKLSELQAMFVRLSIDRVNNPDKYEGSLGVMIVRLTKSGGFEQAHLRVGDVIIKAGQETINGPMDISTALARRQNGKVPFTVIRGDKKRIVDVKSGTPAGALVSSLLFMEAVQL